VTPQLITEILKENPCLENMFNNQLFNLSDENFATALNYISKINSEFEQDDSYSQYIIKNTLSELLMFICRHNDTSKLIIDKGDLRIQAVIDFILEHYPEHITLSDCAKIACMHYNTFSAVFQKTTAIGFKDFLTKIRIDKGCESLENTNHSITEIAESVGFSTATHFSSSFRTLNKMSPKEYRNQFKKQNPNH